MRLLSWGRGVWGLASLLVLASAAQAQANWPDRPVRVIVPFPASGATDLVARVVTQRVAADLGQQLVVDNKPGAGGTLGTAEAAKAAPDGYTLLLTTSSTHAISPHLMPRLAYDARKDFVPVAHVADAPSVLLVTNSLPVKTVGELIAYAKAGRLRALAVTSEKRSSLAPELPTMAESGLPGYSSVTWFGVYLPAGAPPALVDRVHKAFAKAVQAPEVAASLAKLGVEPAAPSTPAQFGAMVQADSNRWATVIRQHKINID